MPIPTTIEQLKGLILSAIDLKELTKWPDSLVEDYLNILDNILLLASNTDGILDDIDNLYNKFASLPSPKLYDKIIDDIINRIELRTPKSYDKQIDNIENSVLIGDLVDNRRTEQKYYAEAYRGSTYTSVIYTQNEWHPAYDMTPGETSDFTATPGQTGTITAIADAGGGDIRVTANNTLSAGDPVALVGSTGYDDLYMVNAATSTTFDVTAVFAATGTGVYIKGDSIETHKNGIYKATGWFSGHPVSGADLFEFTFAINDIAVNKGRPRRKFSNTTDVGNLSGTFFLNLSVGDKVTSVARNLADAGDLSIDSLNFTISRA